MAVSLANMGGVADPRVGDEAEAIGTSRRRSLADVAPPDTHGHNSIYMDDSITFEAYHYWANRAREYEKTITTGDKGLAQFGKILVGKKVGGTPAGEPYVGDKETKETTATENKVNEDEKDGSGASPTSSPRAEWGISEQDWETAQRATRTATWGSIFYLITTDILGPYNVPWAISQMGYGPGFALYTAFGLTAFYSGLQLWQQFVGLDSPRYPLRNYGDLAFRIFGKYARIGVNVLQSFQFFLNVVLITVSSGMALAQMAAGASGNGFLCFIVAEVIFMVCGFVLGQIRTLQRLSFLANVAVWLNVIVIIMTMVVTAKYPPNYAASLASYNTPQGPVQTSANWPADSGLTDRINGLMNGVFAYGGATLFNELMAEMRRPMDFWKGFIFAEIFIYSVYIIMGMVVYSNQGQFAFNPAYQGIPSSAYHWQTLGNAVSFISALIAALLYGNIGVKVFYASVLRDVFHFPPLDHKTGKYIWVAIIPIYWGLALVIAGAIPQISNLTSFVGAACILQFSYTFPPILAVGFRTQRDAILPEENFDPRTGQSNRVDHGTKRWIRGFMKKPILNSIDSIYFLAALATAGLGIYASCIGMHDTFAETSITSFSCANPAG